MLVKIEGLEANNVDAQLEIEVESAETKGYGLSTVYGSEWDGGNPRSLVVSRT